MATSAFLSDLCKFFVMSIEPDIELGPHPLLVAIGGKGPAAESETSARALTVGPGRLSEVFSTADEHEQAVTAGHWKALLGLVRRTCPRQEAQWGEISARYVTIEMQHIA